MDGVSFLRPGALDTREYPMFDHVVASIERAYSHMITELGYGPQTARAFLPLCQATSFVVTANFREWLHILKLRTDKADANHRIRHRPIPFIVNPQSLK